MGRMNQVTRFVKTHDSKLYCERREGKLCVCRKDQRIESYDIDGSSVDFILPASHLVFALTDDWTLSGQPREWGLLPILDRLKEHDLWNRDVAKDVLAQKERRSKSRDRDVDNHIEAYLKEHRRDFARATNDINTSNLSKKENRRN